MDVRDHYPLYGRFSHQRFNNMQRHLCCREKIPFAHICRGIKCTLVPLYKIYGTISLDTVTSIHAEETFSVFLSSASHKMWWVFQFGQPAWFSSIALYCQIHSIESACEGVRRKVFVGLQNSLKVAPTNTHHQSGRFLQKPKICVLFHMWHFWTMKWIRSGVPVL